ncbi:hypothetical protein [Glaciecola sp. 1036]|uniref:hypothetical protein n=1 Tax=Alteromonadaceae TaxID=72275 RepID=UPI003D072F8A
MKSVWWYASSGVLLALLIIDLLSFPIEAIEDKEQDISIQAQAEPKLSLAQVSLPKVPQEFEQDLDTESNSSSVAKGIEGVEVKPQHHVSTDSLAKLKSDAFLISMPLDQMQHNALGTFLYQCVGIGFGSITYNKAAAELIYLSKSRTTPSKILRRVNKTLFSFEKQLTTAYEKQNNLVRLYPMWFDLQLVEMINSHSPQSELKSFTAEYELNNKRLWLKNIVINGQDIAGKWLLANGANASCQAM